MVVHHTPLCLTNDDILVVVPPILLCRHLHPQLYLYKCIDSGVWCLCTTIHTLCPMYNLVWYTTIQPVLSCIVVYHTNVIALGATTGIWGAGWGRSGGSESSMLTLVCFSPVSRIWLRLQRRMFPFGVSTL